MASGGAALLLLGVFCFSLTSAQILSDCCLKKSMKALPLQIIDSYIIQDAGHGCQIKATVIITKSGRKLCVSHPSEREWVRKHITFLDSKRKMAENHQEWRGDD